MLNLPIPQQHGSMLRPGPESASETEELESYRLSVESLIAENALTKRAPKILIRAFEFLSAEIARSTTKLLNELVLL